MAAFSKNIGEYSLVFANFMRECYLLLFQIDYQRQSCDSTYSLSCSDDSFYKTPQMGLAFLLGSFSSGSVRPGVIVEEQMMSARVVITRIVTDEYCLFAIVDYF